MIRPILLGLALASASPALAEPLTLRAEPVALDPADAAHVTVGRLTFLAGFALSANSPAWGGYSGMVLDPDGTGVLALADIGYWLRLGLTQDAEGRLTGVSEGRLSPLLDSAGKPLATKRMSDAEALARAPDGSLLVAFERLHRIWDYRPGDDPAEARPSPVAAPPALASLPSNSGIEAMVVLPQDRLLLLSEGVEDAAGYVRGWLRQGGTWSQVSLVPSEGFDPSDMTLLPDGDVLLLERRYSLLSGAAARLSILPGESIRPGARLAGSEIAVLQQPLTVDNFEAVAARRAPDGGTLVYLVSDDNQSPLQRTLIMQFRLGDR